MNNAMVLENSLEQDQERDNSPLLRQRVEELTNIIEALQNISSSSYWQVLKQYEFDGTLESLRVQLEDEKDTVKMYRLQGEIKRAKKYSLEKLWAEKRLELERIKKQLL